MDTPALFQAYREKMNKRILESPSKVFKRFYALDHQTYEAGELNAKTKELIGLSASLVLRCDDCVKYHIGQALSVGATPGELIEVFEISTVVGGSIVIPHLRRAMEYMDLCIEQA
jgi:AhpD family alkylhydroperoxidase